jgi:hypothetical protein
MKRLIFILTVALSVIMGGLSVQAADIQITSLPFNITAPGAYVFTQDLSYSAQYTPAPNNPGPTGLPYTPAIIVSRNLLGPVVLDFKGYALTGAGYNSYSVVMEDLRLWVPDRFMEKLYEFWHSHRKKVNSWK